MRTQETLEIQKIRKAMRNLEDEVEYDLRCEYEPDFIRGNLISSGDPERDKEEEDRVIEELEMGNQWAWCMVMVTASIEEYPDVLGRAFLGHCSYESEEQFRESGYLDDLREEALEDLATILKEHLEKLEHIKQYFS